jgi:hypothetical protein
MEQLFNARRAAEQGILHIGQRDDAGLADQIAAAYADRDLADRARAFARNLRQTHPADPLAALAARLAPEVAAARAGLL